MAFKCRISLLRIMHKFKLCINVKVVELVNEMTKKSEKQKDEAKVTMV